MRLQGSRAIGEAADAARHFGQAQRLAVYDQTRLCIVIEELVANLYDHGGVTEGDEIMLALGRDPRGVRISIKDPGIAFDPWSAPQTTDSLDPGGGAGIRLIQAWGERIGYRSSNEGNCLEILLPIRRPG